jgi:ribosomal protein S27E
MRKSSLTDPLTDEEVDAANADPSDMWIHVRCKDCGDVECCFNRTVTSWQRRCFPCQMGWKPMKSVKKIAEVNGFKPVPMRQQEDTVDRETR